MGLIKTWINGSVKPEYVPNTNTSRDVIVCANFRGKNTSHCGYYSNGRWFNMSGQSIVVIKWMDFPSPDNNNCFVLINTLKKYIQHVTNREGVDFIDVINSRSDDVDFTDEEVSILESIIINQ